MEEFKMESFHPAEPLVASELPSPLVSKPPKEFADETSSTASEAATSASATAAVATIDHHHHHHHPVGNVSFFVLKAFSSRCDSCGLRRGSEAVFASQKSQKAKCEKTLRPTFHHIVFWPKWPKRFAKNVVIFSRFWWPILQTSIWPGFDGNDWRFIDAKGAESVIAEKLSISYYCS